MRSMVEGSALGVPASPEIRTCRSFQLCPLHHAPHGPPLPRGRGNRLRASNRAPACISAHLPLHARLITHVDVRAARGDIPHCPFRSLVHQGFVRGGDNRKKD